MDYNTARNDPTEVYQTKMLYLNSSERTNFSPSVDRCEYLIPPQLFQLRSRQELLKITLVDFYIPYSWQDIAQDFNNEFRINNLVYQIPLGNPNITEITSSLNSQHNRQFVFSFNRSTSKITITAATPGNHTLTFYNEAMAVLGFTTMLKNFSVSVSSDSIVRIQRTNNIFIRINGLSTIDQNIEFRNETQAYNYSNVLAKIPVNVAPFNNIYFQSIQNNYSLKFNSDTIHNLTIRITDEDERDLNIPLDYSISLKVEFLQFPNLPLYHENLEKLSDNVDLLLLQFDRIIQK